MYADRDNISFEEFFKGKSVLITGACGTIGKNLAKEMLNHDIKTLRLLDLDDTALTELKDELEENSENIRFLLGDVRDKERLSRAFEGTDYVFHCAALKHVSIGEYNPREVIMTNVIGTGNVIEAAMRNNVARVVYTSSDKAVNPVNTMGASKLLGEKLITAANYTRGSARTIFSSVRFGNVLGSRGSIIPRFKQRIKKDLKLIVTDPNMTRFMMPIKNAVDLVITAMMLSLGGEIFVLKMPSVLLSDLVDLFQEYAWLKHGINPKIEVIGLFPGEKNYEELKAAEEIPRSVEHPNMYIILPHIKEIRDDFPQEILLRMGNLKSHDYNSRNVKPISKEELKELIEKNGVFNID
jgi:FlaA1/EpsC-like NDP-sugar epimerase